MHLPLQTAEPVALTLHESVHFPLNTTEALPYNEWESLFYNVYWRYGREHRAFIISFFHQLHCLIGLQRGLMESSRSSGSHSADRHMQHCLNYLRQTILCTSSDSLERGDFLTRDTMVDRIGESLVCQDWEQVLVAREVNYAEWAFWNAQWN